MSIAPISLSAALVADKHMPPDLLHGEERRVWGDGDIRDREKPSGRRLRERKNMTSRRVRYKNLVD